MIGILVFLGTLGVCHLIKTRFKKGVTTHGSAAFMTLWLAVRRKVFFPFPAGLIVGDWKRWMYLPVFYRGDSNILTVAPPGSGKGTSLLIPNALRWNFQVLADAGGQATATAIKSWREKGYRVYVINPWQMHSSAPHSLPSHGINVLAQLDARSRTFASDAGAFAANMVTRTGRESEPRWLNKNEGGLRAIIMKMVADDPPEMRTLVQLRRYIMGDDKSWRKLVTEMQESKSDEAIKNQGNEWARMLGPKEKVSENKEFSGILSEMEQSTKWIDDQAIRDCVGFSEARLEDLKGYDENGKALKGAIVAIVIPLEYIKTHAAFTRLVIGAAILTLEKGKLAKSKVLFTVDEFGALGRVDLIVDGLATLRRYRVWFHLIVQNIGQLKDDYGAGWNKIEGGCELRVYMAPRDVETASHISALCGTRTVEVQSTNGRGDVTKSHISQPLIAPDDVMKIRVDQQIVFLSNNPPMTLRARPYWERPSLRGSFYEDPFHAGIPPLPATWPLQAACGLATRMVGWVLGPSRTAVFVAALAVVWLIGAGVRVNVEQVGVWTYCTYQGLPAQMVWKFSGPCPAFKIGRSFRP